MLHGLDYREEYEQKGRGKLGGSPDEQFQWSFVFSSTFRPWSRPPSPTTQVGQHNIFTGEETETECLVAPQVQAGHKHTFIFPSRNSSRGKAFFQEWAKHKHLRNWHLCLLTMLEDSCCKPGSVEVMPHTKGSGWKPAVLAEAPVLYSNEMVATETAREPWGCFLWWSCMTL